MDMGIVNPATSVLYTDIPADILELIEDVVLNRRSDASERLIELAERLKADGQENDNSTAENRSSILAWRNGTSVEERLKYALTKGIGDFLEEDLAEALKLYPKAVDVIEGPLMAGMNHVEGYLEYGACNDENCLPPTQVPFKYSGKSDASADTGGKGVASQEPNANQTDAANATTGTTDGIKLDSMAKDSIAANVAVNDSASVDLWKPVITQLESFGGTTSPKDLSWVYIFITGFLGGLLALFTPCVWPIIPMTVSFFLKRSKDKKKGIRDAWTYGASIVVIYVTLGLAITALFGASALNALSTNAVFNILFCLLLVVFAASFFGAFELTLPSKWSNAVDSKAEKTSGLLSIFLMS